MIVILATKLKKEKTLVLGGDLFVPQKLNSSSVVPFGPS
jgi:hypothetical protein